MPHKDPEGRREYVRSHRAERTASERERRRARAEADPEWAEAERAKKREAYRRWRDANPELARQKSREQSRRRRAVDPEAARTEVREWHRRKRAADPQWARDAGRRWREANPARHLENRAKQRHGADFNPTEMRNLQGDCCYLCGDPLSEDGRNVNVDHDHSCCPRGKSCRICRRGLACTRCNTLVGLVDDDPDLLRRIADNLEPVLRAVRAGIAEKANSDARERPDATTS